MHLTASDWLPPYASLRRLLPLELFRQDCSARIAQKWIPRIDTAVRHGFVRATGILPDDQAWLRAVLSVRLGGVGLRSISRHAEAAYMSSVTGIADMGARMDSASL